MHKKNKLNKKGFTLAEALLTVAILVVLLGLSFVAVPRFLRGLAQTERDGIAKEIFIAAQNHLSVAEGAGLLDKRDNGTPESAEDGIYYFVVGGAGTGFTAPDDASGVLSLMLPYASVDETVRLGGSYVIRYQKKPAQVLDVFYTVKTGGGRFGHTLAPGDYTNLLAVRGSDSASRSARREFACSDGKAVIGYYGGVEAATLPAGTPLEAPLITVTNAERLTVKVTDPNAASSGASLQLIVEGVTSGMRQVLPLARTDSTYDLGTNTHTVVLDDITASGRHFADLFPDFIPGEDIRVYARVYNNTALAEPKISETVQTNSLFAAVKDDTAQIANIRHLENLGTNISSLDKNDTAGKLNITSAVQTAALSWPDFMTAVKAATGTTSVKVYDSGNRTESGGENAFLPVVPDYPLSYDGKNRPISAVTVRTAGNAGLFGTLSGGRLENLTLEDFSVTSTGAHAGALVAACNGTTVGNVLVCNTSSAANLEIKGATAVGGLAGSMIGGSVTHSAASVYVASTGGSAGGLVGAASGHVAVTGSYAGGHTVDGAYVDSVSSGTNGRYNVIAATAAGGLVGASADTLTVTHSYATTSVRGASAGGLVGTVGGENNRITDCYATGLVKGSAAAGAFAASLANTTLANDRYFEIINGDLTALGGGASHAQITAFDDTLASYNSFATVLSNADPYDDTLAVAYKGKYDLRTVDGLYTTATDVTGWPDFILSHVGDWPTPETKVVNKKTLSASVSPRRSAPGARGVSDAVSVTYTPAADLPEGTALLAAVVEPDSEPYAGYAAAAASAVGLADEEITGVEVLDISLVNGTKTVEPASPVTVELDLASLGAYRDLQIVHFGDTTEVLAYEREGSRVRFETGGFSVYAVVGTGVPLRTYSFYAPDAAGNYSEYYFYTNDRLFVHQQTVKNGEDLIVPQLPAIEGSETHTFAGWYVYTEQGGYASEPLDFDHIPPVTATETVILRARFANYAYVIFHEQYNGATATWPITATRRGELSGGRTNVRIDDITVTYDDASASQSGDDDQQNAAPEMAFRGWSRTPVQAGTTAELEASPVNISGNIDLYPVFVHINWLTFSAGPTGSGATYCPPRFYYTDTGETSFPKPTRTGYTFEGWYTAENGGVRVADANGNLVNAGTLPSPFRRQGGALYLDADSTLYGHWTEAQTRYTVILWRQSDKDDKNAATKTYDFAESYTYTATTGATVSTNTTHTGKGRTQNSDTYADGYTGFWYNDAASDKTATVKGNGSTVLNVYYDRELITYSFNRYGNSNGYTPTCSTSGTQYGTDNGTTFFRIYYINGAWRRTNSNSGTVYTGLRYIQSRWQPITGGVMTGLYGQDLSMYGYTWPTTYFWQMDYTDSFFGGSSADGTGITFLSSFNAIDSDYAQRTYDENIHAYTVPLYSSANAGNRQITHVLQDLNGNYSLTAPYYIDTRANTGSSFSLTNKFEGYSVCGYSYGTFTSTPQYTASAGESASDNTSSTLYVYHSRNRYNLTFIDSYDNRVLDTESVWYNEPLRNYIPASSPASSREGYAFSGWYNDSSCTSRFDFAGTAEAPKTMPMANVIVYAGWDTEWYLIQIDPNGGVLTPGQATWFWEPYNGDPIEEYTTASRNYIESLDGTYYYHYDLRADHGWPEEWTSAEDSDSERKAYYTEDINDATDLHLKYEYSKDAFRYAGWFEVGEDGIETLYKFGEPVTHPTTLKLHWKQVGTYYIRYEAGEGELDDKDNNEDTFKTLDSADYADHSDVVVTRTAYAPQGKNFVGWTIRNDPEKIVYYPGQNFEFQSKFSMTEEDEHGNEKKYLILDAQYTEIEPAVIIYDANGGTVNASAVDYGAPAASDAPQVDTSCTETTATLAHLVNNSITVLSNGAGFTNGALTFRGWNTKPDGTGTHFGPAQTVCVDSKEPKTLYAEWEVKVYFHRNKTDSAWGGTWPAPYTYDAVNDVYYQTVLINQTAAEPTVVPVSTAVPDDNLMFHFWGTKRYTDDTEIAAYDFSTPVTGELHLYAFWAGPIELPVHAADSSAETIVNKDDDWLTARNIEVKVLSTVPLATAADASAYTNVPTDPAYTFAFACVADSFEHVSETKRIASVGYSTAEKCVWVTYADGSSGALADEDEVYLIYYHNPKTLPIDYKFMAADGTLETPEGLRADRKTSATVSTSYDMTADITGPRYTVGNNEKYQYYAFAIGDANAASDSGLHFITVSKNSDSDRPALRLRNTWRGLEYSADGGTNWTKYGYSAALYVIYFDNQPTVVTLKEHTLGTLEDMSEKFTYTVTVTQTVTTVTETQTRSRTRRNSTTSNWGVWSDWTTTGTTTSDGDTTTVSANTYTLADNETETTTLFYSSQTTSTSSSQFSNGNRTETETKVSTTTTVTQTVTVVQTLKDDFTTDNDGAGGAGEKIDEKSWRYTAAEGTTPRTVTFTNARTEEEIELHIALAVGDGFVKDDSLRVSDYNAYTVTVPLGAERIISADTYHPFAGDPDVYTFAGIIYGRAGDDDRITPAGTDVNKISFDTLRDSPYYGVFLNGEQDTLIGDREIYYVYYRMPKVYYVKEGANGALTPIAAIRRNGAAVTLNGTSVASGQTLTVGATPLIISQTAPGGYRVPPDVDGEKPLSLDYARLGVGPDRNDVDNIDDLDAVSTAKTYSLCVVDSRVKYRASESDDWHGFSDEPAVYVIYKEKGYDLTLTKTVADGTEEDKTQTFTVTVTSPAITETSYAVSGYSVDGEVVDTVAATPAAGSTPGSITLAVKHGDSITVSALARGTYTVSEPDLDTENFTMSVKVGDYPATKVNDTAYSAMLDADKTFAVTNTRSTTSFTFTKADGFEQPLAGAVFTLYNGKECRSDQKVADSAVTGADGKVNFENVSIRTYYMKETTTPTGFAASATVYEVAVGPTETVIKRLEGTTPAGDNVTTVFNESDTLKKVILKKTNEAHTALGGAVFSIYKPDMTLVAENCTSDSKNGAFFIGRLPFGVYYLRETAAPSGYPLPTEMFTLRVEETQITVTTPAA